MKPVSKQQDTKAALIRAAERLFAEKGLGGVSVRDITLAAGARNQSALHYHFGGMDELIREVFASRFRNIEEQRMKRLAEIDEAGHARDIHALMRAGIAPLLEACLEEDGRLYAQFTVQLMTDPRFDVATLVKDVGATSVTGIGTRVAETLKALPDKTLSTRLRRVFMISVLIMADYARRVEAGIASPVEAAIDEATETLVGFLLANHSVRTV